MADLGSFAGNTYSFFIVVGLSIPFVVALFAPVGNLFKKIISEKIPFAGECVADCCCMLVVKPAQSVAAILIIFASIILLAVNNFNLFALIITAFVWFFAIAGVLLKKLPPDKLKLVVNWITPDYNSFWMLWTEIAFYFLMITITPIGTIVGIVVLLVLIAIALAVLIIFCGPAVLAAAGTVAETLAPGALEAVSSMANQSNLQIPEAKVVTPPKAAAQASPAEEKQPAKKEEGKKEEKSAASEVEIAKKNLEANQESAASVQKEISDYNAMINETETAIRKAEVEAAGYEKGSSEFRTINDRLERLKKELEAARKGKTTAEAKLKDLNKQVEKAGGGKLKKAKEMCGIAVGGEESLCHICKIPIILLAAFFIIFFIIGAAQPNSSAGKTLQGIEIAAGSLANGAAIAIGDAAANAFTYVEDQFKVCEIPGTGVMCKLLKFRACEPWCTSQTGSPSWKGFEITDLRLFPPTLNDYQPFHILATFTNNGEGEATFSVVDEPTFGFFLKGGKTRCAFGSWGWLIAWEPACEQVFPIAQDQSNVVKKAFGTCAERNGEVKTPCTLPPKEQTTVRWLGFLIKPNVIPQGTTVTPEVTLSLNYKFLVPNDLVGSITVQSFQEQMAASTDLNKEKKISAKINKAYSPPGPLMMAMGTVEDQVVSTVPTIFLIQFANKGKGVVESESGVGVYADNMRIYMPADFSIYDDNLCGFKEDIQLESKLNDIRAKQNQRSRLTQYEESLWASWNPGPGFEKHKIYIPKDNLKSFATIKSLSDTPTIYCVLIPPDVREAKIKSYDFKMRVLKYGYTETRKSSISITGTSGAITSEATVAAAREGLITKTFSLDRNSCQKGGHWTNPDTCNRVQTLNFDGGPYSVTSITVTAVPGGDRSWCVQSGYILFTGINEDDTKNTIGRTSYLDQGDRGSTRFTFSSPTRIKGVEATIFETSCDYIDAVSATITYTKNTS